MYEQRADDRDQMTEDRDQRGVGFGNAEIGTQMQGAESIGQKVRG
jgi:hypothetical protein